MFFLLLILLGLPHLKLVCRETILKSTNVTTSGLTTDFRGRKSHFFCQFSAKTGRRPRQSHLINRFSMRFYFHIWQVHKLFYTFSQSYFLLAQGAPEVAMSVFFYICYSFAATLCLDSVVKSLVIL